MELTLEEKYSLIKEKVLLATSSDPIKIAISIMKEDFISIHGPEHHFLDGASFLAAYKNAGGDINLGKCLETLSQRSIKMPGAMCGYWGVCGSSTSVGSALSIIFQTGPLSDTTYYKDNMELTSSILKRMSLIGGPRCCKRNAFISLSEASKFVNKKYGIKMETEDVICDFSPLNKQCIQSRCPFHKQ